MAISRPPSNPIDLEITIVSAKHLKNVNWRHGDLKPYAIFWVDPDCRLTTKLDDSGSTRPVWNERFVVPVKLPPKDSILTLEVFHANPNETPKPLVGTLRFPLKDLVDPDDSTRLRAFDLRRPSGRPQGKIRLKLALRERRPLPDYHIAPQPNYYYSSAPPPPPSTRDHRGYSPSPSPSPYTASLPPAAPPSPSLPPPPPPHSYPYGSYSDPYSGYTYPGYYSQPPPLPPPRPFFDRQSSYGGPSAPVDYAQYDQKPKSGRMGLGTGLAVGAVAGALGGIALDEGLKYEEEKTADRVESDLASRDDYSEYRVDY